MVVWCGGKFPIVIRLGWDVCLYFTYLQIYVARVRPKPKLPARNREPTRNKVPGSSFWFGISDFLVTG